MITKFDLYCEATEYKSGNLNVLYRDENLTVVVPLSVSASTITCRGTKWCSNDESGFNQWTRKHILFRFLFHDGYKLRLTWKYDIEPPTKYWTDKNNGTWGSGGGKYSEINFEKYPFVIKRKEIDEIEKEYERIKTSTIYNDELTDDWDVNGNAFKTTRKEYYDSWYEVKKEMIRRVESIPDAAIKKVIGYRKHMIKNKETIKKQREYADSQRTALKDLDNLFKPEETKPRSYYHDEYRDHIGYPYNYNHDYDDYFAED